jgi:hypothetical protein
MKSCTESVKTGMSWSYSYNYSQDLPARFHASLQKKRRWIAVVIVISEMHDLDRRASANLGRKGIRPFRIAIFFLAFPPLEGSRTLIRRIILI